MSAATRSALMSRIRGKDTGPELALAAALTAARLRWVAQDKTLPGRPDFVFPKQRVAVFVDGDFWHGWRFPCWRHKLSEAWEMKIEQNRRRDQRNFRRLRRAGWIVIRLWEHELERDLFGCVARIAEVVRR